MKGKIVSITVFCIGLLYPLNEWILQPYEIGPQWARWLLSDLSFPIANGIALFYVFNLPIKYGILIGGFVALSVEYGQMVHIFHGKGHIEDIITIAVGTAIGLIASWKSSRKQ